MAMMLILSVMKDTFWKVRPDWDVGMGIGLEELVPFLACLNALEILVLYQKLQELQEENMSVRLTTRFLWFDIFWWFPS